MNPNPLFLSPEFWENHLLDRFKILKSDHERMNLVIDFIKNYIPPVPMNYNSKNDEKAIKLRKLGNEMFVKKNELNALKMYTESIVHADTESACLGLAYGNRSAVLYRKKYYRECLEDINRALQSNYPEELKEKLLKRQEQARQFVPHQELLNYHYPLPTIENKNPHIQVASDLIEIKKNESLGRDIVVAAKDISTGDLLIMEKPYVNEVKSEYKYVHCSECLELCFNLIPCSKCTVALYCGQSCKQEAFVSYHKYECVLFQYGVEPNIYLKLIIKSARDLNKVNKTKKYLYRSDRLQEILKLGDCSEKMDVRDLLKHAIDASVIYGVFKERTDLFKQFHIGDELLKKLFFKLHIIAFCTCFNISELDKNCVHNFNDIGKGLYPFTDKLRHACSKNTIVSFYGPYLVVRSLYNVKKGEEIYRTYYGFNYQEVDLLTRQKKMSEMFLPKCSCKPCVQRWPTFENLRPGPEIPLSFKRQMFFCFIGDKIDDRVFHILLPEAVKSYHCLKKYEPNQGLVVLSDFIRLTYKSMGNVLINF